MRTVYIVYIQIEFMEFNRTKKKQVKIDYKKKKYYASGVLLASDKISPGICAPTIQSATISSIPINLSKSLRSRVFYSAPFTRTRQYSEYVQKYQQPFCPRFVWRAFKRINKNSKKIRRGHRYRRSLQH